MEQRIKIVWVISLAAMLLIVLGQGYWLWNQCRYTNEKCMEEIHRQVMEAVAVNDSIRNSLPKPMFGGDNAPFFHYSDMAQEPDGWKYTRIIVGVVSADVPFSSLLQPGFADSLRAAGGTYLCDTIRLSVSASKDKDFNYLRAANDYRLQVNAPFTRQRFDSVLAVRLEGMPFTTELLSSATDTTYQWTETVALHGTTLAPVVEVVYPYNPLKRERVRVSVSITPHALLLRMGGQLVGSLLLIGLLAICLFLQVKTILKQRRIDELRRSFVNTMIHELKRPVQALKMCVAFFNDKAMRTDERMMDEVVSDSVSELDNLSAYLQKLRDMTRADDRQTQLSVSSFDLKPMVERLMHLQHIPEGKQVSFETRFTDSLLITADPVHIANIISNLIENAVKYSGPSVHILIDCALQNHLLTIRISDDGIGIPPSEQGKVFDKFYRAGNLPDRSLPGIGLGLSYVKLLVEAHRGRISLSSQVAMIILPIRPTL
ncbi:MAG: HAMP domain-containing sensor histidine kinase [Bacteroides sp.]|nr:HAMP domain-containing sensor histidine kinase [Bacteroides sp.]